MESIFESKLCDVFFKEIQNAYNDIVKLENEMDADGIKKRQDTLINTVKTVMEFMKTASEKGVLSLEECARELNGNSDHVKKEFAGLIMLVVDGASQEYICEVAMLRYFSRGFHNYDAVRMMIYLVGTLGIQQGMSTHFLEEMLLSFLPFHLAEQVRKEFSEDKKVRGIGIDEDEIHNFIYDTPEFEFTDGETALMETVDFLISKIGYTECVHQNLSYDTIKKAMPGLLPAVRNEILRYLPKRKIDFMVKEYDVLNCSKKEIVDSCYEIFKIYYDMVKLGISDFDRIIDKKTMDKFYRIIKKGLSNIVILEEKAENNQGEFKEKIDQIIKDHYAAHGVEKAMITDSFISVPEVYSDEDLRNALLEAIEMIDKNES